MIRKFYCANGKNGGPGIKKDPWNEQIQKQTKVIVIDDELPLVNAFRRFLRNSGKIDCPELSETTSLKAAIALIEKYKPDIIISDKQFDMNNENAHLELLAYVRENYPDTKVVLCSGSIQNKELLSGYDGIIAKPPDPKELRSIVERLADASVVKQKKETKKFLMIDSEHLVMKSVARILRSVEEIEVMDCQPVGSTASAMEVIRELKPDIVLIPTEFKMEFHVGEKLLGQIREEFPEVIVALHAPNAFNSAYDERAAPYDAIISKPCRAGELREIIVKLAKD